MMLTPFNKKPVVYLIITALFLFLNPSYARSADGVFSTATTLSEVKNKLAKARKEHKPVVMEFYASWCSICKAFDRNVLSDQTIQDQLGAFVAIRVDVTEQNNRTAMLLKSFNVYGTPTFLFFDAKGNVFTRVAGDMNKRMFGKILEQVHPTSRHLAWRSLL